MLMHMDEEIIYPMVFNYLVHVKKVILNFGEIPAI